MPRRSRSLFRILLLLLLFLAFLAPFCTLFLAARAGRGRQDRVGKQAAEEEEGVPKGPTTTASEGVEEAEGNEREEEEKRKLLLSSFADLMRRRTRRMDAHCRAMRARAPMTYNYHNLFAMEERRLAWCPVFKAASTSWMDNFFRLKGVEQTNLKGNPIDHLQKVLTKINSREEYLDLRQRSPNTTYFTVVRHPFNRLVSAFRDKIERLHLPKSQNFMSDYYYKLYGRQIVAKYRAAAVERFGRDAIYSEERNYGALLPVEHFPRVPDLPVFWEFVQFVLDSKSRFDVHWAPAADHCSVCSVRYDAVVKFENLSEEEPGLEAFLGVDDRLDGRLERANRNGRHSGMDEDEVTALYFETYLDEKDVEGLFRVYERDFRLFDYEFEFRGRQYPHDG